MTLDPYATLGIPPGASRDEAARAHRRLAKRFHPDINPGPAAAEQMRRINEAWRILSNPLRRSTHDAGRTGPVAGHGYGTRTRATPWGADGYGPRTGTTTWTTWPESRYASVPRYRRPTMPEPVAPSFGDRPVVFVGVWALLAFLFFIATWLGSLAP